MLPPIRCIEERMLISNAARSKLPVVPLLDKILPINATYLVLYFE